MKNSADQGRCCPQKPKAEVDNTLRDLQNSSYPAGVSNGLCEHLEHASGAFLFASTSSDHFSHASSEHSLY